MLAPSMLTVPQLQEIVRDVAPEAILVEPRILRRVIRLDRRLAGLGFEVPHGSSYVIERARLLAYVEFEELELSESADLMKHVILLPKPTEEELIQMGSATSLLREYQREIFHSRIHLALDERASSALHSVDFVSRRMGAFQESELTEIRNVLLKDDQLFPEATDLETYVEFVAVYLELRYFDPGHVAWYFPSIRDWTRIDRQINQDVNHKQLFEGIEKLVDSDQLDQTPEEPSDDDLLQTAEANRTMPWKIRQLKLRARRAAAVGNGIKAAILQTALASVQMRDPRIAAIEQADEELRQVVRRLQPVLCFGDHEVEPWFQALRPLLAPASRGIWPVESRLLYDLQKVCVEHERGIFRLDLNAWCQALGKVPLKRSLPLLREVLITKHLRTALRRISSTKLNAASRSALSERLVTAAELAETRARNRLRPLVLKALDSVQMHPMNVPERVGRMNVVEELLDTVVEQGVATLGHLRDAISRNDIKLPDLGSMGELVRGDQLLQADRQLSNALAGVYRPGAIYLRFAQRISSVAFGTSWGRFLTRHLALPFGGAFLIVEGIRHIFGFASHPTNDFSQALTEATPEHASELGSIGYLFVCLLGAWLWLLMESPPFRKWSQEAMWRILGLMRQVLIDWPAQVVRSPWVQSILRSTTYAAIRGYILWPGGIALALGAGGRSTELHLDRRTLFEIYLVTALFLNSRIGRYFGERVRDVLLRLWQEVRMRIISTLFDWIMESFRRVFVFLERFVYSVDEWLRFRAGDRRSMEFVKLVTGTCWFFVSYFVILAFTLLIEPQINPIKHFPVVTVSHKLLLPAGPSFVKQLAPYIGPTRANTLVWSTIWLIPGVFGFLVWELRENWRLYEANRSRTLGQSPVGPHGETMARLLRPGFHSGTVPKLFAKIRRTLRETEESADQSSMQRRFALLHHLEETVRRFVERKLLELFQESGCLHELRPHLESVHMSTCQIEVTIACLEFPDLPLRLTWEDRKGVLAGLMSSGSWVDQLDPQQQEAVRTAVDGLFQRCGVESQRVGGLASQPQKWEWRSWVKFWSAQEKTCNQGVDLAENAEVVPRIP